MFPFRRKPRKPSPEGINLLGAILISFGEVATVTYDPKRETVKLSFTVTGAISAEEFQSEANFIGESLDAYHLLEGYQAGMLDFSLESQGETTFFRVTRDVKSLSRGEMELLVELMRERFGDRLIVDGEIGWRMDPECAAAQSDILDRSLAVIQGMKLPDHLVGLREGDRVVVYNG